MKIVGLVAGKNESARLAYCLRALAPVVDAIVYLDDNSSDDTVDQAKALAKDCHIERIIEREDPGRDEARDRNLLLRAGRELGGTCFLVLDVDEAFAASTLEGARCALETLRPGEALSVPWTHLWRSASQYRVDPCIWVGNRRSIAFGDDSYAWYPNRFLHVPRVPIQGGAHAFPSEVILLHFQFICWPNVLIKQTWYKFLERIRTGRTARDLNHQYDQALDEIGVRTVPSSPAWFFPFFREADWMVLYQWRVDEMRRWREQHGSLLDGLSVCPEVN